MMMLINNSVPFIGIAICVVVLIKVKYRTMELDTIFILLLFITSFAMLIDADIHDNGFVPVWGTVIARVIQIFIVFAFMSVIKRHTKIRRENMKLKKALDKFKQPSNTATE